MKVTDLSGTMLDYWVAKARRMEIQPEFLLPMPLELGTKEYTDPPPQLAAVWVKPIGAEVFQRFSPSESPADAYPIIFDERISIWCDRIHAWEAGYWPTGRSQAAGDDPDIHAEFWQLSEYPLEAAMRSFLASTYGDVVPDVDFA